MARFLFPVATTILLLGSSASRAAAQDEPITPPSSPEHFAFEIKVGTYRPSVGDDSFREVFGGDRGPMLTLELDGFFFRIPYVGPVGIGLSGGWARYTGRSCVVVAGTPDCTMNTDTRAKFLMFPIAPLAVLRIDVLARELGFPVLFAAKVGPDFIFFRSKSGGRVDGEGVSIGLRWAVQVALELDFLEPRAARTLDEDWGINHSFLFAELYGSTAGGDLPLGTGLSWSAGLGLTF